MKTTRVATVALLSLALTACAGSRLAAGGGAPAYRAGSASDALLDVASYPRRSWHPEPPRCVAAAPSVAATAYVAADGAPPYGPPPPPPPPPPPGPVPYSGYGYSPYAPPPPCDVCAIPFPSCAYPCPAWEVTTRARAWWASISGDLLITKGSVSGSGSTADLRDDFGLDDDVVPTVGVDIRYRRHRVRLAWEELSYDGSATLDSGLIFHGTAYPPGEHVDGSMCLTLWEAGYQYALVCTPCTEVWVGAGVWWWEFCSSLDGNDTGLSESRSFSHLYPIGTVDAIQRFGNFSLRGGVHGGLLADDRYALDLEAGVGWRVWGPIELEAGWRWMRFAFHESTNEMIATFSGPYVGLSVSFAF